ncbi:unnamed protein product [Dovyalis caffra]|uniref:RRM domain-containing protein n=1 Tax=Dovyalis caffra TaxID=77055 RepID=A0AAV1RMC7_9ROSI|nr:unnamed protein product [Dovyalis caffra]
MRFQRGDIVWARVIYPKTWYPGLVSTTNTLGISVAFFNIIKPRYFLESEVCSFKENFDSLVKKIKCSIGQVLLDHVLKLIARRSVSSLRCPCLLESENVRRTNENGDVGSLFCANSVVGFVRGLGVCPFVEDSDFVCAVSWVSQAQMFRRFLVTQHQLLLNEEAIKKTQNVDDCVCLSASGNATHSVARKPVASELEPETLQEDQLHSGLLTQTKQTKPQSFDEMLVNLHCLALDASFVRRGCLNAVKQICLTFGNLSYQYTSNLELKNCYHISSDNQFSYPECVGSQPSFVVDEKAVRENLGPFMPYVASPMNFTGLKRRNDLPADTGFSFKLLKTMPLFSISKADAYLQKRKPECSFHMNDILIPSPAFLDFPSRFCNTEPFLSSTGADAHLQRSRTGFEAGEEIQDCHSMHLIQNMLNIYLAKDASHCNTTPELSMFQENKDNVDILNDNGTCLPSAEMQGPGGITSILKDGETLKSVDYDANEKIADGIQSEDKMDDCKLVLQLSTAEPVINCVMENGCDDDKMANACAETRNFLLSDMNTHQLPMTLSNDDAATSGASMKPTNSGDVMSVETSGGITMISSVGDSSMDTKELYQSDPSDLTSKPQVARRSAVGNLDNSKTCLDYDKIGNGSVVTSNCLSSEPSIHQILMTPSNSDNATFVETSIRGSMISSYEDSCMNNESNLPGTSVQPLKSKVSQQSAVCSFACSNSLHMKFPKGFNLPSETDLIRKFSRFGRVDPLKTKVFQRMGSAQVVFFDELDAVAAYQCAKRKKNIFREETVLYWLGRFERKSRGSNFLSRMSSSNLKSSLKKSTRRGKDLKECTRRVRFTIET